MNGHRAAVELTYTDKCTVTHYEKYTRSNRTTAFREIVEYSSLPCRLSFSRIYPAEGTGTVTETRRSVKLFVSPDVVIAPGSKITVTRGSVSMDYKQSGAPAVYETHTEIPLELFDEKA